MSKNHAIIIQFVLPLTTFYRSGAQKSNVYKREAFVTSWRFHNRAWQPQRHNRLPETYGTLWIHRGALTNQRCSLAIGCGIMSFSFLLFKWIFANKLGQNCDLFLGEWPFSLKRFYCDTIEMVNKHTRGTLRCVWIMTPRGHILGKG